MNVLRRIGRALYRAWMGFARALAVVNTTLILVLVYVLIIGPVWIVMTIARRDLLDRNLGEASSFWKVKEPEESTLERSRRQF